MEPTLKYQPQAHKNIYPLYKVFKKKKLLPDMYKIVCNTFFSHMKEYLVILATSFYDSNS